jgi:hypothetical protein
MHLTNNYSINTRLYDIKFVSLDSYLEALCYDTNFVSYKSNIKRVTVTEGEFGKVSQWISILNAVYSAVTQ